jgi:hypothetical protein
MEQDKKYSAAEAAIAVLKKAEEVLKKSEVLKKYATENSKEPGYTPSELGAKEKPEGRDYEDYEVKKGKKGKVSEKGKRQEEQKSPSKNPKEEAEGNNSPDGAEPEYEFKEKVNKDLEKKKLDKAENPDKEADAELGEEVERKVLDHMADNKEAELAEGHACPFCAGMHKSEDFVELCGDLQKMEKAETKHDRCVEHVKQQSPEVDNPHAVCSSVGVPRGAKSEEAEAPSGVPQGFVPAKIVGSAKLAKFMERVHAKRKLKKQGMI